jgi:hypothetical protein
VAADKRLVCAVFGSFSLSAYGMAGQTICGGRAFRLLRLGAAVLFIVAGRIALAIEGHSFLPTF